MYDSKHSPLTPFDTINFRAKILKKGNVSVMEHQELIGWQNIYTDNMQAVVIHLLIVQAEHIQHPVERECDMSDKRLHTAG